MKKNQIFVFAVFVALLAVACSKDKTKEAALAPVCQTLEMHFDWDSLSADVLDSVYIIVRGKDFEKNEFADTVKESTAKFTYTKDDAQIDSEKDHCPFMYEIAIVDKETSLQTIWVNVGRPVVDTVFVGLSSSRPFLPDSVALVPVGGSRPVQPEDSLAVPVAGVVVGGTPGEYELKCKLKVYAVFKDASGKILEECDRIIELNLEERPASGKFVDAIKRKLGESESTRIFFRGCSEFSGEYFFSSSKKK